MLTKMIADYCVRYSCFLSLRCGWLLFELACGGTGEMKLEENVAA